jgi:hypothetical protein
MYDLNANPCDGATQRAEYYIQISALSDVGNLTGPMP